MPCWVSSLCESVRSFFEDASSVTDIRYDYTSSGLIIALNLFSLASPITNLIGWVLPAYLSIAALESPGHDDDKHWLTYWIICEHSSHPHRRTLPSL